MIVPTIRVIVGDDDCSAIPGRQFLQVVDGVDEKVLLIKGIRVASVALSLGV